MVTRQASPAAMPPTVSWDLPSYDQQRYAVYRWAKEHGWARLSYSDCASTGGTKERWETFIRGADVCNMAKVWHTIAPDLPVVWE